MPGAFDAGVMVGNVDIAGGLYDLSRGGFGFVTDARVERIADGAAAVGEFWIDGEMFQLPGTVSHLPASGRGGAVGFSFADEGLRNNRAFNRLLDDIAERYRTGAIRIDGHGRGAAAVVGHFSTHLAKELLRLTGDKRIDGIDLSECISIDSGGIGLAMIAIERGVLVTGCRNAVNQLMATAGVCKRCAGPCGR